MILQHRPVKAAGLLVRGLAAAVAIAGLASFNAGLMAAGLAAAVTGLRSTGWAAGAL